MTKKTFYLLLLIIFSVNLVLTGTVKYVFASEEDAPLSAKEKQDLIDKNLATPVETEMTPEEQAKFNEAVQEALKAPRTGYGTMERGGNAECSDYYTFNSVHVGISPDKAVYSLGEAMMMSSEIFNDNNQPVTNGLVFARVSKISSEKIGVGDIVDEFISFRSITLKAKEKASYSYNYVLPKYLAEGNYRVTYYFSVGRKFNLSGLPFSNDISSGSFDFQVISSEKSYLHFDRDTTKVNDTVYNHVGNWPRLEAGKEYSITQEIVNDSNVEKKVNVTYETYYWDSLDGDDFIGSKVENIVLQPKSRRILTYKNILNEITMVKIIAETDEEKTIVNVRLSSNKNRLRLNYPALTVFPVKKNEKTEIFSCFHNSVGTGAATGTIELKLTDSNGKELLRHSYTGYVGPNMQAVASEFIPSENLNWAKLSASILDEEGNVFDAYEVVYSCDLFGNCLSDSQNTIVSEKKRILTMILIPLFVTFLLLGLVALYLLRKKESGNNNKI